jgi:uncharacterized protein YlxP (DUF503 family)
VPESTVHIALLSLRLHIPASQSLKSKRMVVKSLKDRLRNRFNASVAEVGELDKWQLAELCICMIGSDRAHLDGGAQSALAFVGQDRAVEVLDHVLEFV